MRLGGRQDFRACSVMAYRQCMDIQCSQPKPVSVGRVAPGWARPAISFESEIIRGLTKRLLVRRLAIAGLQPRPGGRDIVSGPMVENTRWRIRIVTDEQKAFRLFRRIVPPECGRTILPLARIVDRYAPPFSKAELVKLRLMSFSLNDRAYPGHGPIRTSG